MQNTEFMTYQDLLNLANELARKINEPIIKKLQEVEEKLNNLEANKKDEKPEKLVLANAKEIAEHLGLKSVKTARRIIQHPNFPKPIGGAKKIKRGEWRAEEVERFFRINKGKV